MFEFTSDALLRTLRPPENNDRAILPSAAGGNVKRFLLCSIFSITPRCLPSGLQKPGDMRTDGTEIRYDRRLPAGGGESSPSLADRRQRDAGGIADAEDPETPEERRLPLRTIMQNRGPSECAPPAQAETIPPATLTREDFGEAWAASSTRLWHTSLGLMRHRQDAEDVLQMALEVAVRKRATFVAGTSFEAWMSTILRHTAANHRRKLAIRSHEGGEATERLAAPSSVPELPSVSDSGEFNADEAGFDDCLAKGLRSLKPVASACLLLRSLHDLDYNTIAERLGIAEGTAMSHVHRSRARLRTLLASPPCSQGIPHDA